MTKKSAEEIRVAQRAMERTMLGLTLRDRKTNKFVRKKTGVLDAVERYAYLKWNWAGHTVRQSDERWNRKILEWRPMTTRRSRGRPPTRWTDDIKRACEGWMGVAMDRDKWKTKREAYIQQWSN